jgi:hypothetical protein
MIMFVDNAHTTPRCKKGHVPCDTATRAQQRQHREFRANLVAHC